MQPNVLSKFHICIINKINTAGQIVISFVFVDRASPNATMHYINPRRHSNNECVNEQGHHWFRNGFNTLRPRQNGRHFADDLFKCIFLNENVWIPIKISLKLVSKGPINTIPSLVQIMVWRRPGAKPLSEPMMVSLLTQTCVTRPHWVKVIPLQAII